MYIAHDQWILKRIARLVVAEGRVGDFFWDVKNFFTVLVLLGLWNRKEYAHMRARYE